LKKRKSTSTEKPNKNPGWSKHMSFLRVDEFLDFDDLMCRLFRFFLFGSLSTSLAKTAGSA